MLPWQSPAYERLRLLRLRIRSVLKAFFAHNDIECNPLPKKILCGARKISHTQIIGQIILKVYEETILSF